MSDALKRNEDWQEALRRDPRTTPDLVAQVLTAMDDDAAWEPVPVLHYRATREVFETAGALCVSECPRERELGADILGQLGIPERVFADEAIDILLAMLDAEQDEDVLNSICVALGHQH